MFLILPLLFHTYSFFFFFSPSFSFILSAGFWFPKSCRSGSPDHLAGDWGTGRDASEKS